MLKSTPKLLDDKHKIRRAIIKEGDKKLEPIISYRQDYL